MSAARETREGPITVADFERLPREDRYRIELVRGRLVRDYLAAGVRLVWVFDPAARTVTAHAPGRAAVVLTADGVLDGGDVLSADGVLDGGDVLPAKGVLDGGDVLPGFRLPLAAFYAV